MPFIPLLSTDLEAGLCAAAAVAGEENAPDNKEGQGASSLRDHGRISCVRCEESAHVSINDAAMASWRAHKLQDRWDFAGATKEFDQKLLKIMAAVKSAPHLFKGEMEGDDLVSIQYTSRRPRRAYGVIGQHIPIRRLDHDQWSTLQKNITWACNM